MNEGRRAVLAAFFITLGLTSAPAWATTIRSQDWAGYSAAASRHETFQSVKASWTVPSIDCSHYLTIPSIPVYYDWVGLSSGGSSTSERIGVSETCSQTTPVFYTWLAVDGNAPSLSNTPQGPNITTVAGGDQITASISYLRGTHKYRYAIRDVTQRKSFTHSGRCPAGDTCGRSRAEVGSGVAPEGDAGPPSITLYNYGALSFFNVALRDSRGHRGTLIAPAHWKTTRVNEFDGTKLAASASALSHANSSFTDTWHGY